MFPRKQLDLLRADAIVSLIRSPGILSYMLMDGLLLAIGSDFSICFAFCDSMSGPGASYLILTKGFSPHPFQSLTLSAIPFGFVEVHNGNQNIAKFLQQVAK